MENTLIKVNTESTWENKYRLVYIFAVVFSVLLVMRDCYAVGINKYIFVVLTLVAVVALDMPKLLCLFCFLMPLYVGLPGNFMTIIFLVRFLLEFKQLKFQPVMAVSALFACVFMFTQNVVYSLMSMAYMSTVTGIVMVLFLFSYQGKIDKQKMIFFYVLGVAVMGLIMLAATLNEHSLSDLMSAAVRLGTRNAGYTEEDMRVAVDPNYYGTFAISAVSVGFSQFFKKWAKRERIFLILAMVSAVIVALIGLSRSFVVVLVLWAICATISQGKVKNIFLAVVLFGIVAIFVSALFPQVLDTVFGRFTSGDMEGANGRIPAIITYTEKWTASATTFLFGVGMYFNHVHCMPLQYLFGGGVVFSFIMFIFFISLVHSTAFANRKRQLMDFVPLTLTFAMTCTVPIATSLTFMFPFVISIYSMKTLRS